MSWPGLGSNRISEARNEPLMNLSTALQEKDVILLDGAIGTELGKHGLMGRARPNLDNPDVVFEIQREYARCGFDALTTNTLTMNRIYIESH